MNIINFTKNIARLLVVCAILPMVACSDKSVPATAIEKSLVSTSQSTGSSSGSAIAASEKATKAALEFDNKDKKRIKAKGLYLTATSAGERLSHYIEFAKNTGINSYVIDYKDDDGKVFADSKIALAKEIGAIEVQYKSAEVVKKLHENNIYAIARIVCFKDPILAKKKPEFAIKNKDGSLYVNNKVNWVDAYNKNAWQYNIDLAKEALAAGFDEVQFDYIRFPDGKKTNMVFADTRGLKLHENIEEFLAEARAQMPSAILSGDVFAIICESPGDFENIGQYLERVGVSLDYLCPMAYPSHYALGQKVNGVTFSKPDLDPYNVVKNTLLKAKSRLEKVDGHKPIIRSYLQGFTASWIGSGNYQRYGDEQIKAEIKAVSDAGYDEWFIWDPMNNYKESSYK